MLRAAPIALLVTTLSGTACAEEFKVFGVQSAVTGAFVPAGTDWACGVIDKSGRCWDGKMWHRLYPLGPRHYATASGAQISCRVMMMKSGDCWTGDAWYHLASSVPQMERSK
jgi:hypothetical protein